jgi:hypothetical protein
MGAERNHFPIAQWQNMKMATVPTEEKINKQAIGKEYLLFATTFQLL